MHQSIRVVAPRTMPKLISTATSPKMKHPWASGNWGIFQEDKGRFIFTPESGVAEKIPGEHPNDEWKCGSQGIFLRRQSCFTLVTRDGVEHFLCEWVHDSWNPCEHGLYLERDCEFYIFAFSVEET